MRVYPRQHANEGSLTSMVIRYASAVLNFIRRARANPWIAHLGWRSVESSLDAYAARHSRGWITLGDRHRPVSGADRQLADRCQHTTSRRAYGFPWLLSIVTHARQYSLDHSSDAFIVRHPLHRSRPYRSGTTSQRDRGIDFKAANVPADTPVPKN